MKKQQWNALGYMFLVFCVVTIIVQVVASINEFLFYVYWLGIWFVAAITCFICGELEEKDER